MCLPDIARSLLDLTVDGPEGDSILAAYQMEPDNETETDDEEKEARLMDSDIQSWSPRFLLFLLNLKYIFQIRYIIFININLLTIYYARLSICDRKSRTSGAEDRADWDAIVGTKLAKCEMRVALPKIGLQTLTWFKIFPFNIFGTVLIVHWSSVASSLPNKL